MSRIRGPRLPERSRYSSPDTWMLFAVAVSAAGLTSATAVEEDWD
jgi:hypothetical protein